MFIKAFICREDMYDVRPFTNTRSSNSNAEERVINNWYNSS